jgi:hypothetical protein
MQSPITEHLTQQTQAAPRVQPNALPRVQPNEQNTKHRTTQSTATQQPSTTDAHPPHITRRRGRRNNTLTLLETKEDSDHLRLCTKSQSAQEAQQASPPALNTRSKLAANAVMRCFECMENEVQQVLAVIEKDTGWLLNYRQLIYNPKYKKVWNLLTANKFGHLAQGVGNCIKVTNTIKFIHKRKVPKSRLKDVTYGQFVCTKQPEKAEPNQTRFTVGEDQINYPGEVATPIANLLVAKILFNSTISTPGARFMMMDISNFYLNLPLACPEYIQIKISNIPEEIINEYNLRHEVNESGHVHIEANKGMYGLLQAGLIANELLKKQLNEHGYRQSK